MAERSDRSIAGKVALVTGGGRGLGAATARSLTAAGARVFVIDLHRPAAGEAIDERVTYLVGDVTDLGDMTRAVETVVRDAGRLDIVIANAGVVARGVTLRASSAPVVDRLFDVNVGGVLNTVRAALPSLIENHGRLVLISSVFAFVNGAGTIPYAMSKAAVEQLGRGLRVELAAHGVSVTTAYFAMINTDMIRQSVDEDPAAQALLDTQPRFLRRRISPEQAAEAIVEGLCRRDVRVFSPRRWTVVSRVRGLVAPALDSGLTRDHTAQSILGRLDARAGKDFLTT
ncbi:NAD(P)-dependent dehydrogenase (short-subunit alcohol dehydrogenase family) [Streptomyces sp. SAI-144]|uniref:SDR family NAD(P)-dependent oxidoreductase n=1 Tax=Streptomyces sp. SAI-144 TaxID=2940544 RepID=UPI002475CE9A|nr:SDR family NAD(P)-dependent oxidoreductase [Streptomyces sp. SAI-144]MDH6436385.1 NAD(P)-dependent dehydrogenase (short-subunit alcohol dehydrogenase family) [Streptomyces sp. SAI-144]